jgi:hypothetical protein
MSPSIAIGLATVVAIYLALQVILHLTQNNREPRLLESAVPFFDSAIGILQHRANYLNHLRSVDQLYCEAELCLFEDTGAAIVRRFTHYGCHFNAFTLCIHRT